MSLSVLKNRILRNVSNIPGWTTKRKIIVVESDDWGSIRMPSKKVFNFLIGKGICLTNKDAFRYNRYDTLASPEDLSALFEILLSFKDKNNKPCIFTAISVVANPNFQKIKEHDFREYFFEPFTQTLFNYYQNNLSFELWKEGIEKRIFYPQFHGREHLNVAEWMRSLQKHDYEALLCFKQGFWGLSRKSSNSYCISFQSAFDFIEPDDLAIQAISIQEGLALFKNIFGYDAKYFVPPNGPFNNSLEQKAAESGIKYISTSKIQKEPQGYGREKTIFHWLGQQNIHNQRFIVRNCFFEPGLIGKDWVNSCLNEIEIAFRWYKPAVISTHRVNYIGVHDKQNRDNGLHQLIKLLKSILKTWPEVEFFTSDQLGDLIVNEK
jgi:hypothetical protein